MQFIINTAFIILWRKCIALVFVSFVGWIIMQVGMTVIPTDNKKN